uniref:Myosin motor domain-containing protein n=1 Tax=Stomoxys calcitrans TaxID=35570 RepID=A0A1I8QA92_STOCA
MSSEELLYAKGCKVWLPHPDTVWQSALLEENYQLGKTSLKVQLEDGKNLEVPVKVDGSNLPPLRNPAILIGQNDLTSLSYLHEPGVLHNLRVRFSERQIIYTYCGIILVAINPYAELPLYGPNIIRAYRGRSMGELEPHIFALAEEAYTRLEREKCNLSIIVSGESGAGKTVSAKYAMRYFAAVGGSESETQVERKVLASSPIMEAFGNAKTTRNDNSSRFGKFTKLLFKNNMGVMNLTGATMHTYLLEKSRVVFQALGERNYHIFYQLCSARNEYPELILDHQDKFQYLNMGQSPDIDKISDKEQFKETIQAMQILGFDSRQISDILNILAGILHLGNVKIGNKYKKNSEEIDSEGCEIYHDDINLRILGELLKINSDELRKWLKMRQIESVNELVLIPINIQTAEAARDALAKHIYARLFQYIVSVINKGLNNDRKQSYFIGVLDIYGFETFETNSFEQFCINYANEKLQQQFNQHVFKLEQEEYLKEGITWTMIDFYDNQPCIDLIESKLGVLDLLDEECRMPKGSDESWARKLVEKCTKFPHFEKPRFGNTSFFVKHFSDTVEYDVYGFLEKNRDTVSKELANVVRSSKMSLCKQLMEMEEIDTLSADAAKTHTLGGRVVISAARKPGEVATEPRRRVTPSKQQRRSVGSQFRDSLSSLIATLHATTPHYVRCIKPNDDKIAFKWDAPKIVQQLRACGVLETVRISAAGFPSRWSYMDFYMRYQLLCHRSLLNKNDLKQSCRNIVVKWIADEEKYRFGNSQIFFRAGQVAYLEQIRANLRKKYITIIQSVIRRFICRQKYLRLRKTALGIQRYGRGYLARLKAQQLREARAALIIGKYAKGWLCRRRYVRLRRSVCGIQQYARGMLARRRFQEAMDHYRAIQIQRFVRGYLARRAYHKRRKQIIICQSVVRRYLAKKQFKALKAEAKTITHIQNMYKGLENKIISMQGRIDNLNKENNHLKHKNSEISVLKIKLEAKKNLENELKILKLTTSEKDEKIDNLMKQLECERDEKMLLLEENARNQEEWSKQKQIWSSENEELRKQLDEMLEKSKQMDPSTPRDRLTMNTDQGEIQEAYRKLLTEKEILENENYQLKLDLKQIQKQPGINGDYVSTTLHVRSISNASSHAEDDAGYSSTKHMLDQLTNHSLSINDNSRTSPESFRRNLELTSTPKSESTVILIKLRNLLEEEKKCNKSLKNQLDKVIGFHRPTEDSLRVSELEVENEKLRHDYELLRQSIRSGTEMRELEAQHNALQEELKRRREECIQLKSVLQQQSQSLKSFGQESLSLRSSDMNSLHDNELMDAFQAQKMVNKQLELELRALTEENNAHFAELTRQIDDLREENTKLQELLQSGIDETLDITDPAELQQKNRYLQHELKKTMLQYSQVQEELNSFLKKFDSLKHRSDKMTLKLQEQGISEFVSPTKDNYATVAVGNNSIINADVVVGKQKAKSYQGLVKFRCEDLDKIFQRLVNDMTTRVAIGLLPGFPAYVLFMCIRYTDLINADDDVCTLLSKFVKHVKKTHRNAHVTEYRILWLVNSITLLNLLKQYGDVEEYVNFNTEKQNQQLLKNFNLYEYRRVISEIILKLYEALVKQVESLLEPYIVPAILDNDEIQRGRQQGGLRGRNLSLDGSNTSPEHGKMAAWKQLISQLEHFYKQFTHFGLDRCYSEQLFTQIMYFICAVAMNCLMLRGDVCMWETGMVIRYNLGHIEEWVRDKKMSNDVLVPLAPLNQVSQLLQSRKSENDVQSICDLSTNLNTAQVLKIMKSYKLDDYESEITNTFIEKLTEKLNERHMIKNDEFTMDQKLIYPFKVVFKYSDIKLEEIEIPRHLGLDDLLQKI